jgi:catechol 2,3-dioxygenase-like lactoylglutathione lyase family enzyme
VIRAGRRNERKYIPAQVVVEQRLSLVTLGVADLKRAISFYEGLGWQRSMRAAEGVAFFQLGGMGLSLYPFFDLAADAGIGREPVPSWRGIALAHNVRQRGEVDPIVETVERLGGSIVKVGEEKVWGGYGAYIADPDGHLWEIAWNPGFPLDEAGNLTIPQ